MKWATITIPGRPPYTVNAEIEQSIHRIQETNSPALFSHNVGKENQAIEDVERINYFKSIGLSDEVIKLIMQGGSHQSGLIAQEAIPKAPIARPPKDTLEANRWSGIIKHPSEVVILGR